MSFSRRRPNMRRRVGTIAASVLALTGLSAVSNSAQASVVSLKIQFTAAVSSPDTATSPVAAVIGTPVHLDFKLTNTSNFFAPMGKFQITAPTGFTVATPSVDRAGWTASISGQVITTAIARPLTLVGLRPGQSLTLSVVATATPAAANPLLVETPTTWAAKGYGFLGLLRFSLQGPNPVVAVVTAGTATFAAAPNVPLTGIAAPAETGGPCLLDPNPVCSKADLPHGANGNVYFVQRPCAIGVDVGCATGKEVELSADFGTLYSLTSPGSVTITCVESTCFHKADGQTIREEEPSSEGVVNPYDYNYTCVPLSLCGSDYTEREVEEDFAAYPIFVQLKGATSFVQAPRCVVTSDLTTRGVISSPAAVTLGFCVDVNATTRTGNAFSGNLNQTVLFVEDPKMRP